MFYMNNMQKECKSCLESHELNSMKYFQEYSIDFVGM